MISVVVCTTCGYGSELADGRRPGEHFADRVEAALAVHELSASEPCRVQLQRTKCLMSCQCSCTVALQQAGKYSYVLGQFGPDVGSVEALLDFVAAYRDSETGQVPFPQWPQGIKGHFVARIPPQHFLAEGVTNDSV